MSHISYAIHPAQPRRRGGFTLIELLCVIFIISLLAAIALPIFLNTRERSRVALCSTNLHALGVAMAQYTADYGDTFPPAAAPYGYTGTEGGGTPQQNWTNLLEPYVKRSGQGIPHCPSAPGDVPRDATIQGSSASAGGVAALQQSGYGYNALLSGIALSGDNVKTEDTALGGLSASTFIRFPNLTPVFFDAGTLTASDPDANAGNATPDHKPGALRHGGSANYLFADGHLAMLRPSDFVLNEGGGQPDGTRPSFTP